MFDRKKDTYETDYYADENGKLYRSDDFKRGISPMWLLPILLIPIALLVWGGSTLLRQNTKPQELATDPSLNTPKVRNTNAQVGVGGSPDVTSTPAASPTPKNRAEAGIGGGPEDTVPQTPATGHGW